MPHQCYYRGDVRIRVACDRALLVTFGEEISAPAHLDARRLTAALAGARGIVNLHPAFASVLVEFDPRRHTHAEIEALVRSSLEHAAEEELPAVRLVEIPVRYGGEFGPDLDDVARDHGLTPRRVVELHAGAKFEVYFVGFATCFPYLAGLPAELATPRLAAPRKRVEAGSVAIAGAQAGVYPLASPGGWRVIGRTPLRLFDPAGEPPPVLRMGDRVRFVPIGEGER
jgi:KipI family sensor histidine kinase inhibitor